VLVAFLRSAPQIRAHIQLSDHVSHLLEEHVDLAVRLGALPDSTLVATRVALISRVLCASPGYLQARCVPEKPEDLAAHDCITYVGYAAADMWEFGEGQTAQVIKVASRLSVNSAEAAVIAATEDGGIVRVLADQVDHLLKAGTLVRLLPAYEPAPMPLSLVYPGQRLMPLKLRAFIDFATPRLRERFGYQQP
jgi:DNA-binding transcriptional LysR family regulator